MVMGPSLDSPGQYLGCGAGLLLIILFWLAFALLLYLGGSLLIGAQVDGSDELVVKTITVKDKAESDNREFIYTTDREIFSVRHVFVYRELAPGGTYTVEYRPISKESALNNYDLTGCIYSVVEG